LEKEALARKRAEEALLKAKADAEKELLFYFPKGILKSY